jgi:hypothetical protein
LTRTSRPSRVRQRKPGSDGEYGKGAPDAASTSSNQLTEGAAKANLLIVLKSLEQVLKPAEREKKRSTGRRAEVAERTQPHWEAILYSPGQNEVPLQVTALQILASSRKLFRPDELPRYMQKQPANLRPSSSSACLRAFPLRRRAPRSRHLKQGKAGQLLADSLISALYPEAWWKGLKSMAPDERARRVLDSLVVRVVCGRKGGGIEDLKTGKGWIRLLGEMTLPIYVP